MRISKYCHIIAVSTIVCFLLLCSLSWSQQAISPQQSTSTIQKSTATQGKPQTGAAAIKVVPVNPNAPPQGTISITIPQSGVTWYTGDNIYRIEWTCSGMRHNDVNLTLWQSNHQVAVIGTNVSTGRMNYSVPLGTADGGYELHITSSYDARIEARQPIKIVRTTVVPATPSKTLYPNSSYTITWSYTGLPGATVNIDLLYPSGQVMIPIAANVSVGSNGKGSYAWTVPYSPKPKEWAYFVGPFHRFRISSVRTGMIYGYSGYFFISDCSVCNNKGTCNCPSGRIECNNVHALAYINYPYYCVDPKIDYYNCGSCGKICNGIERCVNGSCVCNFTVCSGKCTILNEDSSNCGKCGYVCPKDKPYCSKGYCTINKPTVSPNPANSLPSSIM